MVRKARPEVVVIQASRRPNACRSPEENAKYCSLFFQAGPWTLLIGDVILPNLSLLGLPVELLHSAYDTQQIRPLKMRKVC